MATEEPEPRRLQPGWYAIYRRTGDDELWGYLDTVYGQENPGEAALRGLVQHYIGGTHTILAVGLEEAAEFEITVEIKSV